MSEPESYVRIDKSYNIPGDWLEPVYDGEYALHLHSASLSWIAAVETGRVQACF
ncbi:hypothetical protein K469DRAFT_702849 [Zopfia rhizophila CBS 207.26]|uniref:Uncharacterized protein n=1 Tax=Zopfia rhizophila CBS 207.26 TaxID=1314779 RepID=A0A6A6EGW3_9PEZI|nr:hypothetical protein K469DRAFT_702849 [Zopfia rhizophila CBS 207.26]